MLQTRLLNESDYDKLCTWWENENFTPPPKHKLPLNATGGVMIFKDDVDICAGFLYTTNSSIALLEFTIANKDYREKDRKEAIRLLIKSLCNIGKDLGFDTVFTMCQNPFLINHFKNEGFVADEKKSTEMVLIL